MYVQMKITREIYGLGSISEPLHIYYVIFTEATEDQIVAATTGIERKKLGGLDNNDSSIINSSSEGGSGAKRN